MAGFCLLFLILSVDALGLFFITMGGFSLVLCLYLGSRLYAGRQDLSRLSD